MKASTFNAFLCAVTIFSSAALCAENKSSDPTPRNFITPQSASKVRVYEAKQRRRVGESNEGMLQSSTQVSSSGFAKSCNTTIGPAAGSQNTSGNSGRFGVGNASKDSTVIVTGDVINVCK